MDLPTAASLIQQWLVETEGQPPPARKLALTEIKKRLGDKFQRMPELKAAGGLRGWLLSAEHDGLFTIDDAWCVALSAPGERDRQRRVHGLAARPPPSSAAEQAEREALRLEAEKAEAAERERQRRQVMREWAEEQERRHGAGKEAASAESAVFSDTARKLMGKMGWSGAGPLGKRGQGVIEPVAALGRGDGVPTGLGFVDADKGRWWDGIAMQAGSSSTDHPEVGFVQEVDVPLPSRPHAAPQGAGAQVQHNSLVEALMSDAEARAVLEEAGRDPQLLAAAHEVMMGEGAAKHLGDPRLSARLETLVRVVERWREGAVQQ